MKKFCLILSLLLVAFGCDQGEKMVATEELTPTNPLDFNVEIPERSVPEGTVVIDPSKVSYTTTEKLAENFKELGRNGDYYGNRIFQTAAEALASEGMRGFSDHVKALIKATCVDGDGGIIPTFHAVFPSHEEREAFLGALPGQWYAIRGEGTEKWRVFPYPEVWIVDEKDAYYPIYVSPATKNMCQNFKQ